MTGIHWKHWCPKNGCGKKVIYDGRLRVYICTICKEKFNKEELRTIQAMSSPKRNLT